MSSDETYKTMLDGAPIRSRADLERRFGLTRAKGGGAIESAKHDAASAISGTPATMLGEALALLERARDLVQAASQTGREWRIDRYIADGAHLVAALKREADAREGR